VKKFHHLELVSDLAGGPGRVPDSQYMLQLDSDQEKAQAVKLWFDKVSELCGGRLETENGHDEDASDSDEEEESDAAVEKRRTTFKMTLCQYFRTTGKPTYPVHVDEDVLARIGEVDEDQRMREELAILTRPFVQASANAPEGFHALGQLFTTEPNADAFVEKLRAFVSSEKEPGWSDRVAAAIGKATTVDEVAAALRSVMCRGQ
jgi:hypothetical protein